MYTQQIASAAGDIAQGNPEVESALLNLLGSCTTPLLHRGQVGIITGPDPNPPMPPIYLDEVLNNQYANTENPWFSTLNVSNPVSVFVTNDAGDPVQVNGGWTNWSWGVSWWQYAVVYQSITNKSYHKTLKFERMEHDGYQLEDRRVVEDVSLSFDPASCEATLTTTYVNIKVLVRNDNAGSNSPASDPEEGQGPDGSDGGSSGMPGSGSSSSATPSTAGNPLNPNTETVVVPMPGMTEQSWKDTFIDRAPGVDTSKQWSDIFIERQQNEQEETGEGG